VKAKNCHISSTISQILGRDDVDLINLNKAPIDICHQVLYNFKENVLTIYGDYGIILKKFYDDYLGGLKVKYGGNR